MLDVLSTAEELGKPIGSDAQENKNTYMVLMGKDACEETVNRLTNFAKNVLTEAFDDTDFLCALADSLANRNN
jgi:geranylgeranyl diphosphate synthase type II